MIAISCYEVGKDVGGIENSRVVGDNSIVVLLGPRGFSYILNQMSLLISAS